MKNETERPEAGNIGIFTPDASIGIQEAFCGICGDKMGVKRAILEATSFIEGLSGKKHLHDRFECPNLEEMWHKQVRAIKIEIARTSSKRLEDILTDEVEQIIKTRKETKQVSIFGV
jgi:hypothetical protein